MLVRETIVYYSQCHLNTVYAKHMCICYSVVGKDGGLVVVYRGVSHPYSIILTWRLAIITNPVIKHGIDTIHCVHNNCLLKQLNIWLSCTIKIQYLIIFKNTYCVVDETILFLLQLTELWGQQEYVEGKARLREGRWRWRWWGLKQVLVRPWFKYCVRLHLHLPALSLFSLDPHSAHTLCSRWEWHFKTTIV